MDSELGENLCKFCEKSHENVITFLKEKVDKLYFYKDHYFDDHKIEEAINKNSDVESKAKELLEEFKTHEVAALECDKAKYNFLKGRLLNIFTDANKEAEDLLSKAVKLDPKSIDAWNELGECYWKHNEFKKAVNCFEKALKEKKNKVSLRSLSLLCRLLKFESTEEYVENLKKGLDYAKEAVELDPQDGLSWSAVGNSYLKMYFGYKQNPKTLKQCLSAYEQAEKDSVCMTYPDFHYNKGVTLKYEEEFELALESFSKAISYDPSWDLAKKEERDFVKYLSDITEFVATSGKLKAKRLQQFIQSIDSKYLGPYSGGSYTSSNKQTVRLDPVHISNLKPGANEEKVILGVVVCSVRNENKVPFTFCLVDKEGTCVAVTVYNLADGKGVIIGDFVAIPEPYITDFDFKYKENAYKFRLIRVGNPLVLIVNGKKLGPNFVAGVQISVALKND